MRRLKHDRQVVYQTDFDFCSIVIYRGVHWNVYFLLNESGEFEKYESGFDDWYMDWSIDKLNKVKEGREKILRQLITDLRWAIREAYNHFLDPGLNRFFACPNTIEGVLQYVNAIQKASDEEMDYSIVQMQKH